ncbi:MAG: Integrator complex subunit 4, partial [Paramarteilia canceri]
LDLEHFSEVYAQNSITKNIMSNLIKITSSSNNSAVEKLSTFAGDKKNEFRKKVDRSMKLYKIGCLSAIINVMEDEVVEIRIKAIEVLRKIANMHFSCHSMAANLMMDSLGDDDLSVRLTALNSLRSNDNEKLILTSDDQLVDLISLSQESSYEIRKRVRQCLQLLKMNNPQSILHILK